MAPLTGNCVVAQSGGPTTVINASACGVIQAAMKNPAVFTGVYGALNGVLGILNEQLFDLGREKAADIEALKATPAAALGSCRYKLKDLNKDRTDYERILEVFKAHNIRYFFYLGGNDSMDTADKVSRLARDLKYDLVAMGVPKTIDNDLAETDHCPGFGSVAKYVSTTVMEAGKDTEAMYTADTCTVVEVMGRNAGWIAASTGVAHRHELDAPHLIYMPEVPFSIDQLCNDVLAVLKEIGFCVVTIGEGIRNAKGEFIAEAGGSFGQDSFGHKQLGGAGDAVQRIIEKEVGVKCRYNKLGTGQRNGMHFASLSDRDEAYLCGRAAVEAALVGESCKMVTLIRQGSTKADYCCTTGLAELGKVANGEKIVPRSFINEAGNHVTAQLKDYVVPLMRGEVPIQLGEDGLPVYARLERQLVATRCPKRTK